MDTSLQVHNVHIAVVARNFCHSSYSSLFILTFSQQFSNSAEQHQLFIQPELGRTAHTIFFYDKGARRLKMRVHSTYILTTEDAAADDEDEICRELCL